MVNARFFRVEEANPARFERLDELPDKIEVEGVLLDLQFDRRVQRCCGRLELLSFELVLPEVTQRAREERAFACPKVKNPHSLPQYTKQASRKQRHARIVLPADQH